MSNTGIVSKRNECWVVAYDLKQINI